jgi:hypothetical protein
MASEKSTAENGDNSSNGYGGISHLIRNISSSGDFAAASGGFAAAVLADVLSGNPFPVQTAGVVGITALLAVKKAFDSARGENRKRQENKTRAEEQKLAGETERRQLEHRTLALLNYLKEADRLDLKSRLEWDFKLWKEVDSPTNEELDKEIRDISKELRSRYERPASPIAAVASVGNSSPDGGRN